MNKLVARLFLASAVIALPAAAQDKSSQLHQVMSKNMQEMQSMKMTGDIDRDFATMMKHHHQSGIEMAQVQARNGKDPEMRQQAQKIIEAQKKEIAELDRWLQAKGKSSPSAKSGESTGSSSSGHDSKGASAGSSSSGKSGASDHSGHGTGSK